jgi:NDP-sugar pyrophosphorylase family protein
MGVPVVVLAGGFGTRLRSIVADRPKPMADVEGRPFLEYQMRWLRSQGLEDIVLCVGYRADQIRGYFGDGDRFGIRLAYAVEEEPLGTAGAIRNAREHVRGTFLVVNGDSFLDVDVPALLHWHHCRRTADPAVVGTITMIHVGDAAAYGAVVTNSAGLIQSFREKGHSGTGWINGGVYVLEPAVVDFIADGRPLSIEQDTFPRVLRAGLCLNGFPVHGFFVDIGTPDGYHAFLRRIKEQPG